VLPRAPNVLNDTVENLSASQEFWAVVMKLRRVFSVQECESWSYATELWHCSLLDGYQRLRRTRCLHLPSLRWNVLPQSSAVKIGRLFFRNVGVYLPYYTVSTQKVTIWIFIFMKISDLLRFQLGHDLLLPHRSSSSTTHSTVRRCIFWATVSIVK
jgi:hypothetical protein